MFYRRAQAAVVVHVHGDFSSIVGPMHQKNSKTCKNHENRKIFVGTRAFGEFSALKHLKVRIMAVFERYLLIEVYLSSSCRIVKSAPPFQV